MTKWICQVCGYEHEGPEPPETCPLCGADKSEFTRVPPVDAASPPSPSAQPIAIAAQERTWVCTVCGYESRGITPPDICPECGVDHTFFRPADMPAAAPPCPQVASKPASLQCSLCDTQLSQTTVLDACPTCMGRFIECGTSARATITPATKTKSRRYVVLGSGIAALTAVEQIRARDTSSQIDMITREPCLPYYRINLTRYLNGDIPAAKLFVHSPSWYVENQVTVHLETDVLAYHPTEHNVQTRRGSMPYDRLVVATGARAFVPPIKNAQVRSVHAVRTIQDAQSVLRAAGSGVRVVVLGGGILGLEAAFAMIHRGCEVSVCEGSPHLLPRQLDSRAAQIVQRYFESKGVTLVFEDLPAEILGDEFATGVRLQSGRSIPADIVIVSTGIRSNNALDQAAGLEVKRALVVNSQMQTSAPDVYAAGDGVEHGGVSYGIWPASLEMGKIAGRNASGDTALFSSMPPNNIVKVLDIEVYSVGALTAKGPNASELVHDDPAASVYEKVVVEDGKLAGAIFVGNAASGNKLRGFIEAHRELSSFGLAPDLPMHLALKRIKES